MLRQHPGATSLLTLLVGMVEGATGESDCSPPHPRMDLGLEPCVPDPHSLTLLLPHSPSGFFAKAMDPCGLLGLGVSMTSDHKSFPEHH